jgi:hypothetical protein
MVMNRIWHIPTAFAVQLSEGTVAAQGYLGDVAIEEEDAALGDLRI